MTSSKSTKRALISSILALLMCVAMLIGTTFAWFTDTASTGVNKIQAGNLDVELEYKNSDTADFTKADKNTKVFKEGALWEPGHVEYVVLKVSNAGSLALKYKLGINIASETGSTNVYNNAFNLSDYIRFAVLDGDKTEGSVDRDALVAAATDSKLIKEGYTAENHLTATGTDNSQKVVTLVVWMPTTVGNEANHKKDATAPSINLGINVVATQDTVENDSFDNTYDKDATYPVTTTDELIAALQSKEAIVLGNDITITTMTSTAESLKQTLDFNGHKLILDGADETDYGCLDVCGELTLVDSVGGGGITGKFYYEPTKDPTAVFINDGAVVNLESGTIENVYRGVANYWSGGTFNMTGGKIAVKQASAIESAGVLFHRGGTVNLNGGEISGAIYFEKTATSQPSYTIGTGFTNTNNSVFHTSGVSATKNEDGIWISTII